MMKETEESGTELLPIDEKDITIKGLSSEECEEIEEVYKTIGRPAYIEINLDAVEINLKVLRECATNPKIGVIASVKANAYGHGSVPMALHLKSIGVERLGVATIEEAFQLRQAGIKGPIHVFGSLQTWELSSCVKYNLICTLSSLGAIIDMAKVLKDLQPQQANEIVYRYKGRKVGSVHVKVDTAMSMNGCPVDELPNMMKLSQDLDVPIEGIFTQLKNYEDAELTRKQMDTFNAAIEPYRETGVLFHAANSDSILNGMGTEFDLMTVGRGLYGLTQGLKPVASVHGQAVGVRRILPGSCMGPSEGPENVEEEQWVVIIPVGHADFYPLELKGSGVVIRQKTGERCPVTGSICMDTITVRVTPEPEPVVGESFLLLTANYDKLTSVAGMADITGRQPIDILMALQQRLPRYYTKEAKHCMLWSLTSQLDMD